MRRLVCALCAAFASVTPSFAAPIFFDDFAPASPLWESVSGTWTDAGGVYGSADPSAHTLLPFNLADFSVEVDINDVSDGGIWLRTDNTFTNGMLLVAGGFGGSGQGFYFHKFNGGNASGAFGGSGALFNQGDDLNVRVDVIGSTYSVYLNSVLATSVTVNDFASGLTGVYSNAGETFDNFALDDMSPVPEPATLSLLAFGAGGMAVRRFRGRFSKRLR